MAHCGLPLGLLGICALVVGQDRIDINAYESFFRQVPLPTSPGAGLLNGQSSNLTRPIAPATSTDAQRTLGITDEQIVGLNAIAHDFREKSAQFDEVIRPLVLETRLAGVGFENPPVAASQALEELKKQRVEMVRDHIEKLRVILGDSQFQAVDSYISSRKVSGLFFPTGKVTGVSRKATSN